MSCCVGDNMNILILIVYGKICSDNIKDVVLLKNKDDINTVMEVLEKYESLLKEKSLIYDSACSLVKNKTLRCNLCAYNYQLYEIPFYLNSNAAVETVVKSAEKYSNFIEDLCGIIFENKKECSFRYVAFNNDMHNVFVEFYDYIYSAEVKQKIMNYLGRYKNYIDEISFDKDYLSINFNDDVRLDNDNKLIIFFNQQQNDLIVDCVDELMN